MPWHGNLFHITDFVKGIPWSLVFTQRNGTVMRNISFVVSLDKILKHCSGYQWFETPWCTRAVVVLKSVLGSDGPTWIHVFVKTSSKTRIQKLHAIAVMLHEWKSVSNHHKLDIWLRTVQANNQNTWNLPSATLWFPNHKAPLMRKTFPCHGVIYKTQ